MFKKIFCLFLVFIVLCSSFSTMAFADTIVYDGFVQAPQYNENGEPIGVSYYAAWVQLEHGYSSDITYDDLVNDGGSIYYRGSLIVVNEYIISSRMAYLMALINSCSTNVQSQISKSLEAQYLETFILNKWDDPEDNYKWRSYISASYVLGAFCLYSSDFEQYDPMTSFVFSDWFNEMNMLFLEEWFYYYNEQFAEGNGYSSYIYPFFSTIDGFSGLEKPTEEVLNTFDSSNSKYSFKCERNYKFTDKYVYNSDSLNFGGVYTTSGFNLYTVVMNLASMVQLPLMFAWLPGGMLSVVVMYLGMVMAVLALLAVNKMIRG